MPNQGSIAIASTSRLGISQIGTNPDRPIALNISQVGIDQNSISEIGIGQISTSQIGTSQNSLIHISPTQISIPQIGKSQATVFKTGSKQISSTEIAATQFNPEQVSTSQVNSAQIQDNLIYPVPSAQFDPTPPYAIARIQIDSSKVTFASSVALQQFISSNLPSHDLPYNYLTRLQSTLVTDWHLPTGQLAEFTYGKVQPHPNAQTMFKLGFYNYQNTA